MTTTPAQLSSTFEGTLFTASPEILIVICSDCSERVVILTLSSKASRPRPKTSKPGPKLAVEDGAAAVTDVDPNLWISL